MHQQEKNYEFRQGAGKKLFEPYAILKTFLSAIALEKGACYK